MPVGPDKLNGRITALEGATATTGTGLGAVLSAVLFGEEEAFGLGEEVGLANEGAIATNLKRDRAGVAKVFGVGADAAVACDLSAMDAGLHAGTGVRVKVFGNPISNPENSTCRHGAPP